MSSPEGKLYNEIIEMYHRTTALELVWEELSLSQIQVCCRVHFWKPPPLIFHLCIH